VSVITEDPLKRGGDVLSKDNGNPENLGILSRPVIEVRDLVGGYGDDIILDNLSFDVFQSEIFVILGGSGSGKSTLLKHLIGLLTPISGQVLIEGEDIYRCNDPTFKRILKKIGVLYQSGALFGSMTLAENVALSLEEYTDLPKGALDALVRMKLNQVGLAGFESYLPAELSGGMKKRAGLARAMALNPKILFFDEPGAGLDPVTAAGIDQLIGRINKSLGTTMVIVTHELPSIFALAHRVIMLDQRIKGIIAAGDPKELRDHAKDPYVKRFFNREAEQASHIALENR
jgi:phospholipid/cholesterol/gamma-HCH transport system ATP-binding protein